MACGTGTDCACGKEQKPEKEKKLISGDTVYCIDDKDAPFIVAGDRYLVERSYNIGSIPMITVGGKPFSFYASRFSRSNEACAPDTTSDLINSPPHYTSGGIETIDFILAKELNYCLGNALKYITRAGKKDPRRYVEDLRKAVWYLNTEIAEHTDPEF